MSLIPPNNLPIYLQKYTISILCSSSENIDTSKTCGTVKYSTVGLFPSNIKEKRVWNFKIEGQLEKNNEKYIVLYFDFSNIDDSYNVSFENALNGIINICGRTMDVFKDAFYKLENTTLAIFIKTKFIIKKQTSFYVNLQLNDSASPTFPPSTCTSISPTSLSSSYSLQTQYNTVYGSSVQKYIWSSEPSFQVSDTLEYQTINGNVKNCLTKFGVDIFTNQQISNPPLPYSIIYTSVPDTFLNVDSNGNYIFATSEDYSNSQCGFDMSNNTFNIGQPYTITTTQSYEFKGVSFNITLNLNGTWEINTTTSSQNIIPSLGYRPYNLFDNLVVNIKSAATQSQTFAISLFFDYEILDSGSVIVPYRLYKSNANICKFYYNSSETEMFFFENQNSQLIPSVEGTNYFAYETTETVIYQIAGYVQTPSSSTTPTPIIGDRLTLSNNGNGSWNISFNNESIYTNIVPKNTTQQFSVNIAVNTTIYVTLLSNNNNGIIYFITNSSLGDFQNPSSCYSPVFMTDNNPSWFIYPYNTSPPAGGGYDVHNFSQLGQLDPLLSETLALYPLSTSSSLYLNITGNMYGYNKFYFSEKGSSAPVKPPFAWNFSLKSQMFGNIFYLTILSSGYSNMGFVYNETTTLVPTLSTETNLAVLVNNSNNNVTITDNWKSFEVTSGLYLVAKQLPVTYPALTYVENTNNTYTLKNLSACQYFWNSTEIQEISTNFCKKFTITTSTSFTFNSNYSNTTDANSNDVLKFTNNDTNIWSISFIINNNELDNNEEIIIDQWDTSIYLATSLTAIEISDNLYLYIDTPTTQNQLTFYFNSTSSPCDSTN